MRMTRTGGAVALAVMLGALGVAVAQEQPPAPSGDGIPVESTQEVQLSPQEMLQRAQAAVQSMEATRKIIRQQLSAARKERDVVKQLCLEDKLNQIDKTLSTTDERRAAIQSAVEGNDAEGAKTNYNVLQFLAEQGETIKAEANQCIGSEEGLTGQTEVSVDIDDSIPDEDPSEFPEDPLVTPPPPLASPTN